MTFTFIGDLSTDLDKVRANIGDTVSTAEKFSDEWINGMLAVISDVNTASAALCDQLAARYAGKVDVGGNGANKAQSQLFDHYTKLANRIRTLGPGDVIGGTSQRLGGLTVTGTKEAEFEDVATDDTYARGPFAVGQHAYPGGSYSALDDEDRG